MGCRICEKYTFENIRSFHGKYYPGRNIKHILIL